MTVVTLDQQPAVRARRPHRATRSHLLTRDQLARSPAVRVFDRLVHKIENDLGGPSRLSAIEIELIELFASAAIAVRVTNARAAQGADLDLQALACAGSIMSRVGAQLGLARRQIEVLPTLNEYLKQRHGGGSQ